MKTKLPNVLLAVASITIFEDVQYLVETRLGQHLFFGVTLPPKHFLEQSFLDSAMH